jgi:hypothetical protein
MKQARCRSIKGMYLNQQASVGAIASGREVDGHLVNQSGMRLAAETN